MFFRVKPATLRVYLHSLVAFIQFLAGSRPWLRHLDLASSVMCNNFTRMCSNFTVMYIARCETFGQIMFYSVTKCPTCSKCVVHVDNVYVISRTVAPGISKRSKTSFVKMFHTLLHKVVKLLHISVKLLHIKITIYHSKTFICRSVSATVRDITY
jgi:hypothetical protein